MQSNNLLAALAACALLTLGIAACGGSSAQTPEPTPAPTAAQSTPPQADAPPQLEHTYYQLFWEQIHIATIYRGAGPLRSEEPNHPNAGLSGTCGYMSFVSHYFEHEQEVADLIRQADSLDEFFALLAADPLYEVREEYLEEGY